MSQGARASRRAERGAGGRRCKAAARAREAEKRARASARQQALTGWLPRSRLMPGALAARRRREIAVTIAILVALNLVVWIVRPDWAVPLRRRRSSAVLVVARPALLLRPPVLKDCHRA